MHTSSSKVAAHIALSMIAMASLVGATEQTGLEVGATAPEFSLVGNDGEQHSLASILAKGPAVLIFDRSADW